MADCDQWLDSTGLADLLARSGWRGIRIAGCGRRMESTGFAEGLARYGCLAGVQLLGLLPGMIVGCLEEGMA